MLSAHNVLCRYFCCKKHNCAYVSSSFMENRQKKNNTKKKVSKCFVPHVQLLQLIYIFQYVRRYSLSFSRSLSYGKNMKNMMLIKCEDEGRRRELGRENCDVFYWKSCMNEGEKKGKFKQLKRIFHVLWKFIIFACNACSFLDTHFTRYNSHLVEWGREASFRTT